MDWYWIVILVLAALLLVALGVGLAFFLYLCLPQRGSSASLEGDEGRALYPHVPFIKEKAKQNAKYRHELVTCSAFDGIMLRAKLYPNVKSDRVLLLVHGFHSSISWDFGASFEWYHNAGYTILALDDRAHGSEGRFIGFGALDQKDVSSWMNWTVDRFGTDIKIAVIGVSMGAATVMLTTGNHPIPQLCCAVEDCGYTNLADVIRHVMRKNHYPNIPVIPLASLWSKILAGYSFSETDAEAAVSKSHVPTLFIHGTADGFVPFPLMERVYTACSAPKEKAVFEGAVHGESSYLEPERYRKTVLSFLDKYMN